MTTFTNDTLHTAACLWEAALDFLAEDPVKVEPGSFPDELHRYRNNHGTATLRQVVAELAPRCDAAWEALDEEEAHETYETFDWGFAPRWLEENFFKIIWEGR